MKNIFFLFFILPSLCVTTAWGTDYQICKQAFADIASEIWNNFNTLPDYCQEKIKAEQNKYSDNASLVLNERYKPDFIREFTVIACSGENKLGESITMNEYANEYPNWATKTCEKIFSNPDTTSTNTDKSPMFGYIKDNYNNPISGAEISISKTQCKTTTDKYGYWEIKSCTIPTPDSSRIMISHNNYDDMYYNLSQHENGDIVNMSLKEDTPTSTNTVKFPIFGYVKDEQDKPISFTNILIIDSNPPCGTTTDEYGYWKIASCNSTPSNNPEILISNIEYQEKRIPLSSFRNKDTINLSLGQTLDSVTINECQQTKPENPGATNHTRASDGKCYPSECDKTRYTLTGTDTNARCTEKECKPANAKSAAWQGSPGAYKCIITTCNDGYLPNDNKTACVISDGPCTTNQLSQLQNATAGELKKGKCLATACTNGYEPTNGECTKISGKCDTVPENAEKSHREFDTTTNTTVCIIDKCKKGFQISDDKKSCIEAAVAKLSEEDSKKKIAELQENADAMRAKEQSTENKLLGGASMAATGIGGMQALSAYSEQQADEDAEQAMKAYLATFHCNYGGGINIQGGEKNVELPGGNELVGLYSEYVNLANDLKVRKAALDMRPGIESETILDSATSGLYDDISIGKTSGAFASLARALQDPNSADAAAWAQQKSDSASQLKTGLTMAGIGAIGGAVGNYLINKDAPQERSDEIMAKREKLEQTLDETILDIIQTCNAETNRAKETAKEIKSRYPKWQSNPEYKNFVELAESAEFLESENDITKLKEHPVCN